MYDNKSRAEEHREIKPCFPPQGGENVTLYITKDVIEGGSSRSRMEVVSLMSFTDWNRNKSFQSDTHMTDIITRRPDNNTHLHCHIKSDRSLPVLLKDPESNQQAK